MTDNPGGIEALLLNVMASTRDQGYKFDFIVNTPEVAFEQQIMSQDSNIYHVCSRHDNRIRFYSDLKKIFQKHASEYYAIWENANSLANIDYLVYARRYGIPIRIIHAHNSKNSEGFIRGGLHRANQLRIKRYATHFWSVSDEASEWFYGKGFDALPNYKVITNAIDTGRFAYSESVRSELRAKLGIPADAIVFGNVGRLHPQKNQQFAIDVFAGFVRINPNSRLLIIGKGDLENELRLHAKELGVNDKVIFAGAVGNSKPYYDVMDLFLFPSRFEGLPIALLEAQANGLPCLISDAISSSAVINSAVDSFSLEESTAQWVEHSVSLINHGRSLRPEIINSKFDSASLSNIFIDL